MTKARDIASAIPAPSTVSSAELGFLDGVTSAIQTQVDAKIAKTLTTTTGDIIYASGANTPARLGIGSSAQVLTVSGGVPAWATPSSGGGMTLLETLTVSGNSVTSSTISGSYKNLHILFVNICCGAGNLDATVRFNSDSGANYGYSGVNGQDTSASGVTTAAATSIPFVTVSTTNSFNGTGFMNINRYTDTSRRVISTHQFGNISGGGNKRYNAYGACYYDGSSAITSLTFARVQTDQTFSSGTIYIYGVS
jgi:hypothetical protein